MSIGRLMAVASDDIVSAALAVIYHVTVLYSSVCIVSASWCVCTIRNVFRNVFRFYNNGCTLLGLWGETWTVI